MSSKKSQMAKMLKIVQQEVEIKGSSKDTKKSAAQDSPSTLDMSTIEKASFFEDYQTFGNPLHSTALEDDFSPSVSQGKKEAAKGRGEPFKKDNVETPKRTTQAGRGQTQGRGGNRVQLKGSTRKGKDQKNLETKSKARPLKEIVEGSKDEDMTGKSGSSAPVAEEHSTEADDSSTSDVEKELEASGTGSGHTQRRRRPSLSSEELTDEEVSWNPSKKKKARQERVEKPRKSVGDRQRSKGPRRKSSSGSSSGSAGPPRDAPRQRNVKNPMDLDVVLDSFLEFASQYKETVDSKAVKQAIDALSSSFEDQLTEKITASKELTFLKKENAKMNVIINRKRTKLLEAKNELIRSETQLFALQKDNARLEQRLTDLQRSTTFLRDLGQLHKSYLGHRKAHPDQVETYGPSSLPALLLEARSVLRAEDQLKAVNAKLQRALDQAAHH